MENLQREFEKHDIKDDQRFSIVDSRFSSIDDKLATMKDNHLAHIEKDVAIIVNGLGTLHDKVDTNTKETIENKTNIGWIVKIGSAVWGVALILFAAMVYVVREAFTK